MTAPTAASPTPPQDSSPVFNPRSFADLVEDLRSSEGRATVLIGAGCSLSGGIPLAGGIIEHIRQEFPQAWRCAQQKAGAASKPSYNQCMQALSRDQCNTLLKGYIDRSKINWAHIGLAQLLKNGHLDRVLTTNFDQLITRACALVNVFPAVYDLTAFHPTQMRMAELPDLAVFHLHGQRNGFRLLNDPDELAQHAPELKPVFDHARERRLWIVVGYSGEADPLLELIQAEQYENGLYWIGIEPQPKPHLSGLFTSARNDTFYLHHSDRADHFFMKLALAMGAWPPTLMDQPFKHLREQLMPIAESIEGVPYYQYEPNSLDWLQKIRELICRAEELLKQDLQHHADDAMKLYLADGVKGLRRALSPQVRSRGLLIEGYDLACQVTKCMIKTDLPLARSLWRQACDMYSCSLGLNPDQEDAAFNWGYTLGSEAIAIVESDLSLARHLFQQAGEKYGKSLEINPRSYKTLTNWGVLLNFEAKFIATDDLFTARDLWKKAGGRYAQALEIKPDDYVAKSNWGIALLLESRAISTRPPEEAQILLEHAKNHFQHAEALQPGSAAYNLACIAALRHRPADAIHWLRSCQTHGTLPSEEHFRTDSNLDSIRDTPEFTAWWAEVFGRGDAAMG